LRYWGIFLGIALLFWLPIEDTTETWALLFAIAISTWLAIAFFLSKRVKLRSLLVEYILSGTLAGILVTPIALLLMAIKTGFHAHEAPEYTSQQLVSTVWKTPLWIVGGFLVGLGSGIWLIYRETTATIE
jgi:uncharacterized membrane protein YedE/YeeE